MDLYVVLVGRVCFVLFGEGGSCDQMVYKQLALILLPDLGVESEIAE